MSGGVFGDGHPVESAGAVVDLPVQHPQRIDEVGVRPLAPVKLLLPRRRLGVERCLVRDCELEAVHQRPGQGVAHQGVDVRPAQVDVFPVDGPDGVYRVIPFALPNPRGSAFRPGWP